MVYTPLCMTIIMGSIYRNDMAISVNESGTLKSLGIESSGSNISGVEYLGKQPCNSSQYGYYPTFNLNRPIGEYKYMILFGHVGLFSNSAAALNSGVIVFCPEAVYNNGASGQNQNKRISVSFIAYDYSYNIYVTDLSALTLQTFNQGIYHELWGIY